MGDRRYSAEDIRQSKSPEEISDLRLNQWPVYYVLLGPSDWLAARLLNASIRPNSVTYANFLVAALIPFVAGFDIPHAALCVGLLAGLFLLLDCVDGGMARAAGLHSPRGAILDFAADTIFRICLAAGLGLLASAEHAGLGWIRGHGLELGLLAAALALAARLIRMYEAQATERSEVYALHLKSELTFADRAFCWLAGLEYMLPLLIAVIGYLEDLRLVLVGYVVYFAADLVITLTMAVRRA